MKIATVCSGIGSPEQALKELNVPHEIAFACEIDKYARQTYLANFTPGIMYQDLTTEEWDKPEQYSDLFIGGIPCQAFSLAGKRLGELDKRGLLFYDFYRYVKNQQPKVFIIENVKGLLYDNNGITFQNWCALLGRSMNTHVNMFNHDDSLLYNLHFKVLNSKDFGVPQNRERVFLVGVRNDLPNTFRFPIGERLTKRLKDILEPEVDEKYYLSEKMLDYLTNKNESHKFLGNGFKFEPRDIENIASCITARCFKQGCDDNYIQEPYCVAMRGRNPYNPSDRTTGANTEQRLEPNSQGITNTITSVQKDNLIVVKEATKKGYAIAKEGDSINLSNHNSETRRGRVGDQIANTLDTACNQAVVVTEPKLIKAQQLSGIHESSGRVYSTDVLSPKVTAKQGGGHEPFIEEVVQLNPSKESGGQQPYQHNRVYADYGLMTTLDTDSGRKSILTETRIRRLTPLECFRLQGYPDSFIKPCSDSQTYKQAGNSITVNVMKAIIKNIIPIL